VIVDLAVCNAIAEVVAGVFAISALVNFIAPPFVRRTYARWNFPPNFHRVIAVIEAFAAAFLAFPATRIWGVTLAALIAFYAVSTLLKHRQYAFTVPGILTLIALVPASLAGPF
jgi:hypothetical protein